MKVGIYADISNDEYHEQRKDGHFYSSSQLKTMLEDPEIFHATYIAQTVKKKHNPAFDIGNYFHTAILEPHKLEAEFGVYPGAVRKGKVWEEFKEENKEKTILIQSGVDSATACINAVNNSPIALGLLENSEREVSCFVEIYVDGKEILCRDCNGNYLVLGHDGWHAALSLGKPDTWVKILVKVRADSLKESAGQIADLKSSTGNMRDAHAIKNKVSGLSYDLSASLYIDIFNAGYLAKNGTMPFKEFWWIFASKDKGNSKSYLASKKNIQIGRAKWMKSIFELAKYIENEWEFIDEAAIMEPASHELEWLEEKETITSVNSDTDLI